MIEEAERRVSAAVAAALHPACFIQEKGILILPPSELDPEAN